MVTRHISITFIKLISCISVHYIISDKKLILIDRNVLW